MTSADAVQRALSSIGRSASTRKPRREKRGHVANVSKAALGRKHLLWLRRARVADVDAAIAQGRVCVSYSPSSSICISRGPGGSGACATSSWQATEGMCEPRPASPDYELGKRGSAGVTTNLRPAIRLTGSQRAGVVNTPQVKAARARSP